MLSAARALVGLAALLLPQHARAQTTPPETAGDGVCQLGQLATECGGLAKGASMDSLCSSGCPQEMTDCASRLTQSGQGGNGLNTMAVLSQLCTQSNKGVSCAQLFSQLQNPSSSWIAPCAPDMAGNYISSCSAQCAATLLPTMSACGDSFSALAYAGTEQAGQSGTNLAMLLDDLQAQCKVTVTGSSSPASGSHATAGDGICQIEDVTTLCGPDMGSAGDNMEMLCAAGCFQEMTDCEGQLITAAAGNQTMINAIVQAVGFNSLCDSGNCASQMSSTSAGIQRACGSTANGAMPDTCSHECAAVFLPFMKSCGDALSSSLGAAGAATVRDFFNFQVLCQLAGGQ